MDFSIIIPTFQRPDELRGCLEALSALSYPPDAFEVIVVNDGGDPDLEDNFASLKGCLSHLRFIRQENSGPGAARNLGARCAAGRWLAFTDDDCLPDPAWLNDLAAGLVLGEDVLCGGTVENALLENVFSATSQLIHRAAYKYFNADPMRSRFLSSNNLAAWKQSFLAANGFDPDFRVASEDRELSDRWARRHGRVVWIERAVVFHRHELDVVSFFKQHYGYGQGAAHFHWKRSTQGGRLWNDVTFRSRVGRLLLEPAWESRFPLQMCLSLLLWQAANTAGFLRAWCRLQGAAATRNLRTAFDPR